VEVSRCVKDRTVNYYEDVSCVPRTNTFRLPSKACYQPRQTAQQRHTWVHGISKAFPMAERGFAVYHTTPFSFRFALADTLPDGARTTIRSQEESTEREEGIGSMSSPIVSLRHCLCLPPPRLAVAVRRVRRKGIS